MLKKLWQKPQLIFLSLFAIALVFYSDAFSHFFYQDDLFHFQISRAESLQEAAAWFNPINEFGYQIYRPLGTQVVFFVMQSLFGLNHSAFTLLIILLLSTNSWLIWLLLRHKTTPLLALLLSVFYLTHHQNIGIVYFLSTVQLSLALFFTLLALHTIRRKPKFWQVKVWLLYIVAIFCQEISLLNSLIFAILLWLEAPVQIKKQWRLILALGLTTLAYLAMRFYFINAQIFDNEHYQISLNLKSLLNNSVWFGLWLLSVPEYVVNFVGSGLRPLPPLFGQYRLESILSLSVLAVSASVFVQLSRKALQQPKSLLYFACFLFSLAPVLVFPWHKYVYHLPIASVFVLLYLAELLGQKASKFAPLLLALLIAGAVTTNFIDRSTSYNYQRGKISGHFKRSVAWEQLSQGSPTILVANDPDFTVFSPEWGNTSTQAKIIFKDNLFFTLLSGNEQLRVIYEDDLPEGEQARANYTLVAKFDHLY